MAQPGTMYDADDANIPADLARLSDLPDWQIVENEPDPRGWYLTDRNGDEIGKIQDLLVSPATRKAFFAVVNTGGWLNNRLIAVPLRSVTFDADNGRALSSYAREQFENAPIFNWDDHNLAAHLDHWGPFA